MNRRNKKSVSAEKKSAKDELLYEKGNIVEYKQSETESCIG
jgi:hypothetical protein